MDDGQKRRVSSKYIMFIANNKSWCTIEEYYIGVFVEGTFQAMKRVALRLCER